MDVISVGLLTRIFGLFFVFITGLYIYIRLFSYNYWKKRNVACPEPTVPTGNIMPVVLGRTSIGEFYANAYTGRKTDRYFGIYAFVKPHLVIADPVLIKIVLTKDFNHFHDRGLYFNEQVDPLSSHLFFLPGTKWRKLRAKISPSFSSRKFKEMFVTLEECSQKLTKHLKSIAEKGEIIDIKDLYARFSTDFIMSMAFGISCDTLENSDSEVRYWGKKIFETDLFKTSLLAFAPKLLDLFSVPLVKKGVTEFFLSTFREVVQYREANHITKPDFLNLIIQMMKIGNTDGTITELEGAAQAFVYFFAGFETSSSTIAFCLYELARNPDIQDKLKKDIDNALEKHGGLTYESLQGMTYLNKIVAETLRKYPSFPMLNRVCTEDIDLATTNLHVNKGVSVIIPVLGIHHDPEIYPEPDKFDPERFNAVNIASRHPYAYLPFGEGPRTCIGARFGDAQTKIGIIGMISKYQVRLGPNTPIPLEMDPGVFLLVAKGGVHLYVEPRSL